MSHVKVCLHHFTSFIQIKVEGFKYVFKEGNSIITGMPYWHIKLNIHTDPSVM